MVYAQKKEKENLPLHPLKEKDKEKERSEEKRNSLAEDNGGENDSSLKTSENKASDSPDKGENDCDKGENDCDKGSGTKKAATKENAEASAANEDGSCVNTTSSHSKGSTPSAAGGKEARIESFLAYFSNYWNSVLTSTNSRLRPIRVVNGKTQEARQAPTELYRRGNQPLRVPRRQLAISKCPRRTVAAACRPELDAVYRRPHSEDHRGKHVGRSCGLSWFLSLNKNCYSAYRHQPPPNLKPILTFPKGRNKLPCFVNDFFSQ